MSIKECKTDQFSGEEVVSIQDIPREILEFIVEKRYIGEVESPEATGYIKGPCGDAMEFSVSIKDDVVEDVKFSTTGCFFTFACGTMTAHLVKGRKVGDSLKISAAEVISTLKGLPKSNCHCAILAVSTYYKAIANYWLEGER